MVSKWPSYALVMEYDWSFPRNWTRILRKNKDEKALPEPSLAPKKSPSFIAMHAIHTQEIFWHPLHNSFNIVILEH